MNAWKKLLDWFVIPLALAAGVLFARWGQQNLIHGFVLPLMVIFWRMFVLSARRTDNEASDRRTRRAMANWHALSILACLFLMAFEAGVAMMAESRADAVSDWLLFVACTYVPFVLLIAWAEWFAPRPISEVTPA